MGYLQHDAEELMELLLDGLHEVGRSLRWILSGQCSFIIRDTFMNTISGHCLLVEIVVNKCHQDYYHHHNLLLHHHHHNLLLHHHNLLYHHLYSFQCCLLIWPLLSLCLGPEQGQGQAVHCTPRRSAKSWSRGDDANDDDDDDEDDDDDDDDDDDYDDDISGVDNHHYEDTDDVFDHDFIMMNFEWKYHFW